MPEPASLSNWGLVIDVRNSVNQLVAKHYRADLNTTTLRAPDILAGFLRQRVPPSGKVGRFNSGCVIPIKVKRVTRLTGWKWPRETKNVSRRRLPHPTNEHFCVGDGFSLDPFLVMDRRNSHYSTS